MKKVFAVTAALALLSLGGIAQAITIDTVAVGNAGNTGELSGEGAGGYGEDRICGSVGYNYNIGKYEVTAGQYTSFLNAVAATDTYKLYNTEMQRTDLGSGISRSVVSSNYTYSVATDFINRPVNYVSYWDSIRFVNWLHNGQPTGLQSALTTEDGAYTISGYNGYDGRTIQRRADWKWAVTSEDEWYKAAYYNGGGTSAGYWDYPTSSNTAPGQDMADASGNNANIWTAPYAYPIDPDKFTTVVGEFQNSDSPYGTFDQGGNVWEWNEAMVFQDSGYAYRRVRGGSFRDGYYDYSSLQASARNSGSVPVSEYYHYGFRVVQAVPEPSSIIALLGGLTGLIVLRRRRA